MGHPPSKQGQDFILATRQLWGFLLNIFTKWNVIIICIAVDNPARNIYASREQIVYSGKQLLL